MKKQPASDEIQSMLREGHVGASSFLPPEDPVMVNQMMLPIDRIKPYDRNPRREPNPRYAEIKASIRAQGGLNNPLTITRRPGDDLYMIESGGNTRLQILNELYTETGDERFFGIHCLFRPWVSESRILSAHLIENELRGEMVLIDKALALLDLKTQMEQETGKTLSRNEFVRRLGQLGYAISKRHIIRFEYAATVLYPLIPMALHAGIGRPQIERIRKLETASRAFWESRAGDDVPPFDEVFRTALAAHDDPEFDLEVLRQDLEGRISAALNVSIQLLRLETGALERTGDYLDNLSEGGLEDPAEPDPAGPTILSIPSPVEPDPSSPGPAADPPVADTPSQRKTEKPLPDQDTSATTQPEKQATASSPPANTSSNDTPSLTSSLEPAFLSKKPDLHSDLESMLSTPYSGPTDDTKSLRRCNYALALQIARRNGLEPCIAASPRLGMGFLVDLPEVPFDDLQVEDLNRRWIWWLLLSLSEVLVQLERLERIEGKYRLRDLFLNDQVDPEECFQLFGEPAWPALGYQFLNDPGVDERDFRDLMRLAANCRRLRKRANDDGELTLWSKE